jgi:hypothetical protein
MGSDPVNSERKGIAERHLHTIILLAIVAAVTWFGNRTMNTSDIVIRLEVQVAAIHKTLTDLSKVAEHPYSDSDAQADKQMIRFKFDILNERIDALEERLSKNGG